MNDDDEVPVPIDPGVLARAMHYATLPPEYVATLPLDYPIPRGIYNEERIAAEYARLTVTRVVTDPDNDQR